MGVIVRPEAAGAAPPGRCSRPSIRNFARCRTADHDLPGVVARSRDERMAIASSRELPQFSGFEVKFLHTSGYSAVFQMPQVSRTGSK